MAEPVAIIGAGPAGLACATELVEGGRSVVLIDDNRMAGGQYFRQLPAGYRVAPDAKLLRDKARFDGLAKVLSHPNVRYLPQATVWAAPTVRTIAYASPQGSGRIRASAIVIASGAQERSLPFTGWTLPGVVSAGGCLNLAKAHGLVPTGRVVVAGNGPLVLVAAATLIAADADVIAIVEAQRDRRLAPAALAGAVSAPGILATAMGYRARIMRSKASFRTGWMVCEARGDETLEKVALAPIGPEGRPILTDCRWLPADMLVLGYGLLPGTEAARMLGCRIAMVPDLNGAVPWRAPNLETSVEGVYAIGDGAGIGGVEIALLEGRIAAHAILGPRPSERLSKRYAALDRFRRKLNLAYRLPSDLVAATDETILCRCEEISLGRLRADANSARGSLNALKTSSRLGMGRCQGRNCLHAASGLLGFDAQAQPTYPRIRPPLRPVQLAQLAADADAGPAREPDEINLSESRE